MHRKRYVRHRRLKKNRNTRRTDYVGMLVGSTMRGYARYRRAQNSSQNSSALNYSSQSTYTDDSSAEEGIIVLCVLLAAGLIWGIVLLAENWKQVGDLVMSVLGLLLGIAIFCVLAALLTKAVKNYRLLNDTIHSSAPERIPSASFRAASDEPYLQQLVQLINRYDELTASLQYKQALARWHQDKAEACRKLRRTVEQQFCLDAAQSVRLTQSDEENALAQTLEQFCRDFSDIDDGEKSACFHRMISSLAASPLLKVTPFPLLEAAGIPAFRDSSSAKEICFFLQDHAFILDPDAHTLYGIEYAHLSASCMIRQEPKAHEDLEADDVIVGITFLHTRKDGRRDLRYSDNPSFPLVERGYISLRDPSYKLHLFMQFKRPAAEDCLNHIQNYLRIMQL